MSSVCVKYLYVKKKGGTRQEPLSECPRVRREIKGVQVKGEFPKIIVKSKEVHGRIISFDNISPRFRNNELFP